MHTTSNLPLVSIIVPVFNVEKYLNSCVDSIIRQTYKQFEVILVDDGSEDNSGDICDNYLMIDSRIKVFHTSNQGVSHARNFGISQSKGSYLLFIDSDDYIADTLLSECISQRDKGECLMFRFTSIDGDSNEISTNWDTNFPMGKTLSSASSIQLLLRHDIDNFIWRLFSPKKIWIDHKIAFPSIGMLEDLEALTAILLQTKDVYFLPSQLYFYRKRAGSALATPTEKSIIDGTNAIKNRNRLILNRYPNFLLLCEAQTFCCHLGNAMTATKLAVLKIQMDDKILKQSIHFVHTNKPSKLVFLHLKTSQLILLQIIRLFPERISPKIIKILFRLKLSIEKMKS